ncbi:hypothetical protein JAAARDRAFT_170887 [Jaapia argillacea MUCL 33604]|uniref:Nickel/cobalt efflux system n=1 Tax=Jaapia argillacea MUCL 33604 TaxID=933084 RepID=A0A067Q6A7_9AGAM|nr:hypothetical protein JAAARDRAFT_170887 [Jaapia argillacea MUCL 33604]
MFQFSLRRCRLTLFGRSLLLVVGEVAFNVVCWIVSAVLFTRSAETRSMLGLALLAWTIGLRHGLDADHISAIDNATRGLISLGQLPVTCGLFFSIGHSTIVIAVNVAIAISTSIYNRLGGVSSLGGTIGTAISGSFLFLIGLANSIILWNILKRRRKVCLSGPLTFAPLSFEKQNATRGQDPSEEDPSHENMIMMRILGPIVKFVNRPWKMYPVGVLFGLGFDTASSIALLTISGIAKRGPDGKSIPPGYVVILPLLFTAGMSLVDSIDSVLMLYSYSGFAERSFKIFATPIDDPGLPFTASSPTNPANRQVEEEKDFTQLRDGSDIPTAPNLDIASKDIEKQREDTCVSVAIGEVDESSDRRLQLKRNTMSSLSIILTLMSILVAFSIALIEIMGLIGDNCGKCKAAANAADGGGLAGSWWRGWARANDNSGYVGAGIVGGFLLVVSGWYGCKWVKRKWAGREGPHSGASITK